MLVSTDNAKGNLTLLRVSGLPAEDAGRLGRKIADELASDVTPLAFIACLDRIAYDLTIKLSRNQLVEISQKAGFPRDFTWEIYPAFREFYKLKRYYSE